MANETQGMKLLSNVPVPNGQGYNYAIDLARDALRHVDDVPSVVYDALEDAQVGLCLHDRLKLTEDAKRPLCCLDCGREWMVIG